MSDMGMSDAGMSDSGMIEELHKWVGKLVTYHPDWPPHKWVHVRIVDVESCPDARANRDTIYFIAKYS